MVKQFTIEFHDLQYHGGRFLIRNVPHKRYDCFGLLITESDSLKLSAICEYMEENNIYMNVIFLA